MKAIKKQMLSLPHMKRLVHKLKGIVRTFPGSGAYWDRRYDAGGNSGVGSYGKFAVFKAETLNAFVTRHAISSVIEFGCGDGNQLATAAYPQYTGLDVSDAAISLCLQRFTNDETKTFKNISDYSGEKADLALSLDVIFHLVEDDIFEDYMRRLFSAAERYVIVYSSNSEDAGADEVPHVRHRCFTDWVDTNMPNWKLSQIIPNRHPYTNNYRQGSFSDFFIYSATS